MFSIGISASGAQANADAKRQVADYFRPLPDAARPHGEAICAVLDALPPCSSISGTAYGSIPHSPGGTGSVSIQLSIVRAREG